MGEQINCDPDKEPLGNNGGFHFTTEGIIEGMHVAAKTLLTPELVQLEIDSGFLINMTDPNGREIAAQKRDEWHKNNP